MRATMFSPCVVGRLDTRKFTCRPPTRRVARPSWGTRISARSRSARIFMRVVTADCMALGISTSWNNAPSTRVRTRIMRSSGSKWMSLARLFTARVMIWRTTRMTGASSSLFAIRPSASSRDTTVSRSF